MKVTDLELYMNDWWRYTAERVNRTSGLNRASVHFSVMRPSDCPASAEDTVGEGEEAVVVLITWGTHATQTPFEMLGGMQEFDRMVRWGLMPSGMRGYSHSWQGPVWDLDNRTGLITLIKHLSREDTD